MLEAFPGDPLQIVAILGREGSLERPSVRVLGWLAVPRTHLVVNRVNGKPLGAAVEQGGRHRGVHAVR